MEILSTGEKIKRARIYKGYTLKDICDEKISLSKMSCIENGKVKPEDWILEYVGKKLDLSFYYLKEGEREQIINNIKEINLHGMTKDYEEKIEYNLNFAEKSGYYDLSFELMHILINYYMDIGHTEKLQELTVKYYNLYKGVNDDNTQITYYLDMGRYLFGIGEYDQAINYYSNIRKAVKEKNDMVTLAKATYNETACYLMVEDTEKAYELSLKLEDLIQYVESDEKKADTYQLLAVLSIIKGKNNFKEYENNTYRLFGDLKESKAKAIYNFAYAMLQVGDTENAIIYMDKAVNCYPKKDKEKLVNFMLVLVETLIQYKLLNLAETVCDEVLDYSIDLDNVKFIERSYYYKSLIFQLNGDYSASEVYINLSFDALKKFGTRLDLYNRYIEMANIYYKLGDVQDSLKYFNLAISMSKKL